MSTPAWLSVIAIFFTLFNFLYLLTKDIFVGLKRLFFENFEKRL